MQRILLQDVQEGMTLAKPVYGENGQIMINIDVALQASHIARLLKHEVQSVYVQDQGDAGMEADNAQTQTLHYALITEAHKILDDVQLGKYVDITDLKEQVLSALDKLCRHCDIQPILLEMQQCNDYLFRHAVSGYLFAMLIGISKEYEGAKLQDLGVGALLRDIGMIKLNREILNKPGKLSEEETEIVRSHTEVGYDLLRDNPDIALISANCALQHHERFDGSGYPRSLANNKIHDFSHIIAVADVYASLITQTPYRNTLPVYDALAIIQRTAGSYFNPESVRLLTKNVVKYPLNAVVRLNNKQTGTIAKYKDSDQTIPIVRIPRTSGDQVYSDMVEINPMEKQEKQSLYIAEVL